MAPITVNCVSVRRMSEAKCDPYCSHQSERRFTPELPLQIVPPSHSITSSAFTRRLSSTQAELQDEYLGYCGAMLAIRTTLPHFSDSAAMKAANSWALSGIGTVPRSASRASIVGSASTAPIARSRRAMTAAGVPLGAPKPAQVLASYPGNASAIVGTSD